MINNIINKILKLTGTDGLLHILVAYAVVITIGSVDSVSALWIIFVPAAIKEIFDRLAAASWSEIRKDLFCDIFGIALGGIVLNILKI